MRPVRQLLAVAAVASIGGRPERSPRASEIATALVISPETVRTFVSRILAELNLRDRVQAVVYAYRQGPAT